MNPPGQYTMIRALHTPAGTPGSLTVQPIATGSAIQSWKKGRERIRRQQMLAPFIMSIIRKT